MMEGIKANTGMQDERGRRPRRERNNDVYAAL